MQPFFFLFLASELFKYIGGIQDIWGPRHVTLSACISDGARALFSHVTYFPPEAGMRWVLREKAEYFM